MCCGIRTLGVVQKACCEHPEGEPHNSTWGSGEDFWQRKSWADFKGQAGSGHAVIGENENFR